MKFIINFCISQISLIGRKISDHSYIIMDYLIKNPNLIFLRNIKRNIEIKKFKNYVKNIRINFWPKLSTDDLVLLRML